MKIELTIKTTYLPEWGVWEGVRELIQNGKDAEVEFEAPLTVTYRKGMLSLVNTGITLPYESLLLGHTTKEGNDKTIGQFGEGLKLGLLSLVRAGRKVKIRSGSELWVPTIEKSTKFNSEVLCVNITKGRKELPRVGVEVEITPEEWDNYRRSFIFLAKIPEDEIIETPRGSLLLGHEHVGRLYVKGVYVETDPSYSFGYNFGFAKTDRDRKMVRQWDKNWEMSDIWLNAVNSCPEHTQALFLNMLECNAEDVKNFTYYNADSLNDSVTKFVCNHFIKKHGDNAVPVDSLDQSALLSHLGSKGVVVPTAYRHVISIQQGNLESVIKSLEGQSTHKYSWHELSKSETANIHIATNLVGMSSRENSAGPVMSPMKLMGLLDIVDFRSESTLGQFKDGRLLLAKKILQDREETIATVIHELAHYAGGDGTHSHVARMETLWKGVVKHLLKSCNPMRDHNLHPENILL